MQCQRSQRKGAEQLWGIGGIEGIASVETDIFINCLSASIEQQPVGKVFPCPLAYNYMKST